MKKPRPEAAAAAVAGWAAPGAPGSRDIGLAERSITSGREAGAVERMVTVTSSSVQAAPTSTRCGRSRRRSHDVERP